MPLWRIYSHPSTFSPSQREGLAKSITKLYVDIGLPPFYVNVLFIDTGDYSSFVSGEATKTFVRITVEQIARTMPSPDVEEGRLRRRGWMDMINATLKPWIEDRKELQWEIHISETPRDLWRTQGIDPPSSGSETEKVWVKQNKPTQYRL